MADKAISELLSAEQITATDMFVLEQNGTAKKLTGQVLLNWLTAAADGHGGIQSIAKLSTSGLADTYRITLADTTVFDFVVTNGRGISSLQKTGTSGLVDTYTFTYNDGTKATFTVTNGQKGDKGDNAYIWVKYASQEPTASSNSFGDLPDDWMGVYFGTASTAPTSWQSYKWYRIKGEKGDTGEPAKRLSVAYAYQVGDTGNIIPSGTWLATIPNVPQGKFLWIRKTTTWNVGDPDVDYSISRMGLDGSGSVSSVADISPDENGNVPLTAEHIGALPNTGGDMAGAINMNGHKIKGLNAPTEDDEPATKGYVDAKKLSMDLLWVNDNPTSEISGKIPLDLIGYNFVDVECRIKTTTGYYIMNRIAVGTGALFKSDDNNGKNTTRVIRPSSEDVDFTRGFIYNTYGSYAEDNSVIIPTRIYGVKGGL